MPLRPKFSALRRSPGLRIERTRVVEGRAVGTGEYADVPCGLVVPAIGYRSEPIDGVVFDEKQGIVANTEGRVSEGVYAVGWVMRGPTGVIATNRPDGVAVARHICDDIGEGGKPGRPALESLLREKNLRRVSYGQWQDLDKVEIANAQPGAPRRKFYTVEDMLRSIDGSA